MVVLKPLRRRAALLLALGLLARRPALAQGDARVAEYRVKAAFLFKFLPFVEWPPQAFERADSALVIGVLGADALADELETIVASRTVNERRVQVRRLRRGEAGGELHAVFVGRLQHAALAPLVAAHRGRPLLTVTELEDGAGAAGSTINFVVVDDRVRFDIAQRPPDHTPPGISSRLLALARRAS